MEIRKYKEGDELYIHPTDEMMVDWDVEEFRNELIEYIKTTDTEVITDNGIPVCICNLRTIDYNDKKVAYVWFLLDKNANSMVLRYVKKLIDNRNKLYDNIITRSIISPDQDKLHKFLEFKEITILDGRKCWLYKGNKNGRVI